MPLNRVDIEGVCIKNMVGMKNTPTIIDSTINKKRIRAVSKRPRDRGPKGTNREKLHER